MPSAALAGDGTGPAPLLLPVGGAAYLLVARRPTPHVVALVSADATGRVRWHLSLPPPGAAASVAALGGDVVVAAGATAAAVTLVSVGAATGRPVAHRSVAWPTAQAAAAVMADGAGGLLLSGSTANLPVALSGLGYQPTPLVDLTAALSVRWQVPAAGDVVALGDGTVVSGVRDGALGQVIDLAAFDVTTGARRWQVALTPGFAPRTASFAVAGPDLVWAFTGPGGGGLAGAVALHDGLSLWQAPSRLPVWVGDGAAVVAGASPWQRPARLTVRNAATGRVLWQGGAGTPLAVLGGRLLAETPAGPATPAHLSLWSVGSAHPVSTPVRTVAPAPPWPFSLYCGAGGATLWTPWQAGTLWSAPSRPG